MQRSDQKILQRERTARDGLKLEYGEVDHTFSGLGAYLMGCAYRADVAQLVVGDGSERCTGIYQQGQGGLSGGGGHFNVGIDRVALTA